jgi:hypothetical protein
VLKRLEPAVAQRDRLLAERWLPAIGLGDCSPRVLGIAALSAGDLVWHIYEDLGQDTLATCPDVERIRATVDLIAELHTRAADNGVLPDVRRYAGNLGIAYFIVNVDDAISALERLASAHIDIPRELAEVPTRLLERLLRLREGTPRRARTFEKASGPDTLLHGDLWPTNAFVTRGSDGSRARLIDWDRMGIGPFSYDLSTFLFRFPPAARPTIVELYRQAVARAGWRLAPTPELEVLFDTAERARYANCVIWPAQALLDTGASWGFPQLAEVERWFLALDGDGGLRIDGDRKARGKGKRNGERPDTMPTP